MSEPDISEKLSYERSCKINVNDFREKKSDVSTRHIYLTLGS